VHVLVAHSLCSRPRQPPAQQQQQASGLQPPLPAQAKAAAAVLHSCYTDDSYYKRVQGCNIARLLFRDCLLCCCWINTNGC
jgi:hypothetical protein